MLALISDSSCSLRSSNILMDIILIVVYVASVWGEILILNIPEKKAHDENFSYIFSRRRQ